MSTLKKSLGTLFPAMRISFALVLLTTCILLSAEMMGFMPNETKFILDERKKISESLAIQFSVLAPDKDIKKIHKLLRYIVKRNQDILSAGIRLRFGQLVYQSDNHTELWQGYTDDNSTSTHVVVPIFHSGSLWGNVELRFAEFESDSFLGFFNQSIFKMAAFVLLMGFFVFLVFMLRTLRQLDPSSIIPDRVNAAFDTLAEGVIILDENQQIVLTNKAFNEKIGCTANSLMGFKASELKWERIPSQKSTAEFPWMHVLNSGESSVGTQMILNTDSGKAFKLVINASPIISGTDKTQGVLITLDDITELEQRNTDLQTMVTRLEDSHAEVKQKNKELHFFATRDSMTGCLNRRTFSEQFDELFNKACEEPIQLSCMMADLDHFKQVNDNYGHATGDEVIKLLAEILKSSTRKVDLVGRYGGEEFCVVFPGLSADEAFVVAERIRLRMKDESSKRFEAGPRVTVSIGVANFFDKLANSSELNKLADEALYVAKESGRNCVVIWQPESELSHSSDKIESKDSEIAENTSRSGDVNRLQNRIVELENIASKFSAELEYNKSYDVLTGLPNQILFYDRISQAIERGSRHKQLAALLIIDIEMFSEINATLGRTVGDLLLQQVADRLETIFRKTDGISRLTISRFAGDEFAVLLTDLSQKEQVTWVVKRLLDGINKPVEIEGNTIYMSCYVGISLYPTDANNVDDLLNNAMTAKQYSKKLKAKIDYQFYDPHMQELSIKHLQMDQELRLAIENDQWQLLYQPKLDIKLGKIVGVEALIRWNHPQRGVVSPFEFIEFAEQRGLIIPIGNWVIKQACRQILEWKDQGLHDCVIAINLSSLQLMQVDLADQIFDILDSYAIPPRLIELEITETALMNNIKTAMKSLQRLHSRGMSVSIDDFGTGYSSFSHLKNLPINCLKIDRTFIKDICEDENDKKIVQTLVYMAHSMDMTVVAEGVEEKQQYELLTQYSCNLIQGYLLSKPISANAIVKMVKNPQNYLKLLF